MDSMEKRVEALEKAHGPGVVGAIATKIIRETSVTDAGLTACGETWERRQGESDDALRNRALGELLKNDRRVLMRKVFLEYIKAMWEKTCPGSAYRIEGQKVREVQP